MPTTKVLGSVFLGDAKTTVHRHFPAPGASTIIITPPASPSAYSEKKKERRQPQQQQQQQLEDIFARMQEGEEEDLLVMRQSGNGGGRVEDTKKERQLEGMGGVTRMTTTSAMAMATTTTTKTKTTTAMTEMEAEAMNVTPTMSLELRVRWLEALLVGVNAKVSTNEMGEKEKKGVKERKKEEKMMTLFRRAEELQKRMESIVNANDGLKKFMERYDTYAPYLTPSFALSGTTPGSQSPHSASLSYSALTPSEFDALLSEMESEIRSADRDLREIDELEKRGVVGAGKLRDCEMLRGRLEELVKRHEEDLEKAKELEGRVARLLEQHATKVDSLSELFVAWNDVITEGEDKVGKAERERAERKKLGYE